MGIADELITRGWCQDQMEDSDGRVCLVGAGRRASGIDGLPCFSWWETPEAKALLEAVPAFNVGQWNDTPGRTFDEVLRVAKEADEILEAQRWA